MSDDSLTTTIRRRAMTLISERYASAFVVHPCNCWCCNDLHRRPPTPETP